MVIRSHFSLSLVAPFVVAGCNVSTPHSTGGVTMHDAGGNGGTSCDHGTVVLLSDFTSTQIALSTLDGTTLSSAFLSTGSTKASGLAFALSGDVALPNVTPASGRVVLLDRYGTNVITWADPADANVLAQLPVGTGFESNPQDYFELDATRAYVSRWGINDAPGRQPFDSGSDVIVLDTHGSPSITASIAMPVEDGLPPRPSGMVRVRDTVMVVLQRISKDFSTVGDSAIVGIANDAIAWEVHVAGLRGCGRPALSPSGAVMALACEGQLGSMTGTVTDPSASAIALFDVTSFPPKPGQRFAVADQLASTTQDRVVFASETLLIGKTQSTLGGPTDNQAFTLDVSTGKTTVLFAANKDAQGKGKGAVYGDILCRTGCGNVCLMADADLGKLRRWSVAADGLHAMSDVTVETMSGLPPMSLGGY